MPEFVLFSDCDTTLDNARLEIRCPLDNGRHVDASTPPRYSAGQLDQFPAELLVQILLETDIPSLTCFRRVNHRAMEFVDSIPQYAALIRHCPNIIRGILSIQADAFSCGTLYRTLATDRCSTCQRFGDRLYLLDCCRVCYFCFTNRPEYFPLTVDQALGFFSLDENQRRNAIACHQLLHRKMPPSVITMVDVCLPNLDKTTRNPRRFMTIISAPLLLDAGRQADWGYTCLGSKEERMARTVAFRIKYTRKEILEYSARYGPVEEIPNYPGVVRHVSSD